MALTKVTYSMIQGRTFSVQDFGAVGNGVADDSSAIQEALDYINTLGGGTLLFPTAIYKVNQEIVHDANVTVDLQQSLLDFSSCSDINAWRITQDSLHQGIPNGVILKSCLMNGTLKGVTTPADGVFNATANGIRFEANQISISNITVLGFQVSWIFGVNAYAITLYSCLSYYSKFGWYADSSVFSNSGAQLLAIGCGFAHESYSVFNVLAESTFVGCYFDSFVEGCVFDNRTVSGGLTVSNLIFTNCRFEGGGNASFPLFKNSGRMLFDNPQFISPLTFQYFFDNSGEVVINGGFTRLENEFSTSRNTGDGCISIVGFQPVSESGPGWQFTPSESGVFNNNIETGTLAGFVQTSGTPGALQVTTAITPHSGTYCLRMIGGPPNTMQSYPIKIKADAKRFLLNMYMQNRSAGTFLVYVKFFDNDDNELGLIFNDITTTFTTWTRVRFVGTVPNSAAYAKFELNLGLGILDYVYMDDFYVNHW
jgi:hypothetical protein